MKKVLIFFFIIVIFLYALFIEPKFLLVRTKTIYLPNWDEKLDGVKIGIISDLHIGCNTVDLEKLKKIVNEMNKKSPDLVVLLGDFDAALISASKISFNEISATLSELKATSGVYSILGNHDYFPSNVVVPILDNAGIVVLENQAQQIKYNNVLINIIGLKDFWHHGYDEKCIQKMSGPSIVLSHNPDVFPLIPQKVSITLSGHTHGGEISFPLIGSPFVPSDYHQKYAKGYVIEKSKHLYVSGGVGTLSRFRFFNPPEISVLEVFQQADYFEQKDTTPRFGFKRNYIPVYRAVAYIGKYFL